MGFLSNVFARIVALIGALLIFWRRLKGEGNEAQALGGAPAIPTAKPQGIPTLKMPTAQGWSEGQTPTAASGLKVNAFAADLKHPRWIYVLPNRDVLVAEALTLPGPIKTAFDYAQYSTMRRAAAVGDSPNRITLLRDADGDGVAETRTVFIADVSSPFGMALIGNDLYVAATDALLRYRYEPGATSIATPPSKVVDLPAGSINHHWTKNVIASRDGRKLYVTVGSNSNVAENGLDNEKDRAAIWEVDVATGAHRIFASGLRNPNGMAWEPRSGALWTSVNERDELGSDLVPDYMTSVVDGGFYGWPFSYYGQHVDSRVKDQRPDLVATARVPDYALGAHTASLGLASSQGTTLPDTFKEGMFVGRHGSWNRKPRSGYDVVFVPFTDGKPSGSPVNVLTDFVSRDGDAYGRPVGVAIDGRGALLVADDVGNTIWRVTAAKAQRSAAN